VTETETTSLPGLSDDLVQPFQIESTALRGRLVRLGPAIDTILTQQAYPEPIAEMLGEAIVLAVILAGALKYDGIFTLQTKGDGPVRLMVTDVMTSGAVRGYAQYDAAKLEQVLEAQRAGGPVVTGSVPRLLGAGHVAFTVDQGEHTDRYQGIVELQGATLADCAHHYFRQSEQLQTGIKIAVGRDKASGTWRAGGIMLQRLPPGGPAADAFIGETQEDDWRRAMVLMSSCTSAELLDAGLAPEGLLFQLFHEDGVRIFAPHRLEARCRCSRERIERVLRTLPREDLVELANDQETSVTCEFCSTKYVFAQSEITAMRAG
jgi:molecular chaperone Hsp33